MATAHQIHAVIQAAVSTALAGVTVGGVALNIEVGIGWPSAKAVQNVGRAPTGTPPKLNGLVSIYDHGKAHDATRWLNNVISRTLVPPGVTSVLAATVLAPGAVTTATFGGSPKAGDGVGLIVSAGGAQASPLSGGIAQLQLGLAQAATAPTDAVVVIPGNVITPAAYASDLITAIGAAPRMKDWLLPTSTSADVVSLLNYSPYTLYLQMNVNSLGSQLQEVGRRKRGVGIVLFAPTEAAREAMGGPIDSMLAAMETQDWPVLPDGTYARITYVDDGYQEGGVVGDVYRYDFSLDAEYSTTVSDILYPILVPSVTVQLA